MNSYRDNERGSVVTIVTIALLAVLFVAAAVFSAWAYMGRQDYKNNVQKKIDVAVQTNTKKVQAEDAAAFAEESKNPLRSYNGPSAYGSIRIDYPRTWSAYLETTNGTHPIDFYVHPDIVPGVDQRTSSYALRVQVVAQSYDSVIKTFESLVRKGSVKVSPYALAKNPNNIGAFIDGQLTQNNKGKMVVLPVRDKTFKIWTESDAFYADFEKIILPNASFVP